MKQTIILLFFVTALFSCKKSTDNMAALTLTKADFGTNFKPNGTGYVFAEINIASSNVVIPARGDD